MSRIETIDPKNATGKAKELLQAVHSRLGITPNMMRAMAVSPAVLEGYLQFSDALANGTLSAKTREQIALAVGQANGCGYCLAAHSAIGKMVGLTPEQITDSRQGTAVDGVTRAALTLAQAIVANRGLVSDADLAVARSAGLDDAAIAETVANVAVNIFTNYFNQVAGTVIDFPAVPGLENLVTACSASGFGCG
jgi:uncharacterized peroxidase-related enzyme